MFSTVVLNLLLLAYPAPRDREPPDKGPGYLGVTFEAADDKGIQITEIRPNGPAMHSKLQVHDIIRKFDGEPVNFRNFSQKIVRVRPGTVVPMEIQRDSQKLLIKVKIGVRPDDFPYPLMDPDDMPLMDDLPAPTLPPP